MVTLWVMVNLVLISQTNSLKLGNYVEIVCGSHHTSGNISSYSLASPEEFKLMRAFVQINLSQFAVRSCGEWPCLQQGNDSQISYLFFSYFNLFS